MNPKPFTCGLDVVFAVVGGKWKPLILFYLAQNTLRYGELRRAVGKVSDKVLIQQLKELQADGLIARTDYQEVPPRVDYALTSLGRSIARALVPLCEWGTKHETQVERIMQARPVEGRRSTRRGG